MRYTVLATAVGAALAANAWAGPDKIKFPSNHLKGVLYQTVDRPDVKQYRELYAPAEVVEAVRKGKPIPDGAVLTLVQWSVEQDANADAALSAGQGVEADEGLKTAILAIQLVAYPAAAVQTEALVEGVRAEAEVAF